MHFLVSNLGRQSLQNHQLHAMQSCIVALFDVTSSRREDHCAKGLNVPSHRFVHKCKKITFVVLLIKNAFLMFHFLTFFTSSWLTVLILLNIPNSKATILLENIFNLV